MATVNTIKLTFRDGAYRVNFADEQDGLYVKLEDYMALQDAVVETLRGYGTYGLNEHGRSLFDFLAERGVLVEDKDGTIREI